MKKKKWWLKLLLNIKIKNNKYYEKCQCSENIVEPWNHVFDTTASN